MQPTIKYQDSTPVSASLSQTVVEVKEGRLLGYLDYGVYTFRGIPYATAPRFGMPEQVKPWDGIRDATRPGEIYPQTPSDQISGDEFFNPHRYLAANEHCQFLNVWTPAINDDRKRPVMVWLHGGGFTDGSSIEPLYDGRNISEKGDLVFVSLNHRLSVGGFLDLSAFGDKYQHSANAGIADIVAALMWVQVNIEKFGGDPDNVTILGQSGGGAKVLTLMATPAAEGLFHKAIVQSGAALGFGMTLGNKDVSKKVGELTVKNLGLSAVDLHDIQEMPYEVVVAAANKATEQLVQEHGLRYSWGPVLDDFIPVHPVGQEFAEQSKEIPLLIGTVLNEFTTIIMGDVVDLMMDNKNNWDQEKVMIKLRERYGSNAEAVYEAFARAYPNKIPADAYFVDTMFRIGSLETARKKADQNGAPVYSYMFTYESPVMDGVGMAWHCAEIPYVLNNAELIKTATGGGSGAQSLAHMASLAWINFACSGDPNHDWIPNWPTFTTSEGAIMIMDSDWYVGYNHDEELLELLHDE